MNVTPKYKVFDKVFFLKKYNSGHIYITQGCIVGIISNYHNGMTKPAVRYEIKISPVLIEIELLHEKNVFETADDLVKSLLENIQYRPIEIRETAEEYRERRIKGFLSEQ